MTLSSAENQAENQKPKTKNTCMAPVRRGRGPLLPSDNGQALPAFPAPPRTVARTRPAVVTSTRPWTAATRPDGRDRTGAADGAGGIARRMSAHILNAGKPAAWCTTAEFRGGDRRLSRDLRNRGLGHVLVDPQALGQRPDADGPVRADRLAVALPEVGKGRLRRAADAPDRPAAGDRAAV